MVVTLGDICIYLYNYLFGFFSGLISDDSLIEVKCLFSASKLNLKTNKIEEVLATMKNKVCLEIYENKIRLKIRYHRN